MIEIIRNGRTVAKSRNLRGILDYARKSPVRKATVSCYNRERTGNVYILFEDGSECRTEFAGYIVAVEWIRARRSWQLEAVRCSDDLWEFYFPSYVTR